MQSFPVPGNVSLQWIPISWDPAALWSRSTAHYLLPLAQVHVSPQVVSSSSSALWDVGKPRMPWSFACFRRNYIWKPRRRREQDSLSWNEQGKVHTCSDFTCPGSEAQPFSKLITFQRIWEEIQTKNWSWGKPQALKLGRQLFLSPTKPQHWGFHFHTSRNGKNVNI